MAKKTQNPKKIKGGCPLNPRLPQEQKIVKSQCPAIRKVRAIRRELLALQRQRDADSAKIEALRAQLRNEKVKGTMAYCDKCPHRARLRSARARAAT